MLLRLLLASIFLVAGAAVSTRFVMDLPMAGGTAQASTTAVTIARAPFSLGNPTAAASLVTKRTARPYTETPEFTPYKRTLYISRGDTLSGVLAKAGVEPADVRKAISALRKNYDPSRIRKGDAITLTFKPNSATEMPGRFLGLSMDPTFNRRIIIARKKDGRFGVSDKERNLILGFARAEGNISHSLFADGKRAGIPVTVIAELIRAYSWDVDFQRDIRAGDGFRVMYERYFDETGKLVHNGRIIYAQLNLSGKILNIYSYKPDNGPRDYFDEKGQTARKALMRTPIDGARLSSGFGRRRHPILGYVKQHRGIDFAAPRGTPIYAAGDGVVEVAGRNGAYGNYVRIRHNSEYSTAYAHMKRIGTRRGRRVRQGQVIGYVGTTGRSTGPHLHYEILHNGRRVNPLRVKMPSGRKLRGSALAKFTEARISIDRDYAKLAETVTAAN